MVQAVGCWPTYGFLVLKMAICLEKWLHIMTMMTCGSKTVLISQSSLSSWIVISPLIPPRGDFKVGGLKSPNLSPK